MNDSPGANETITLNLQCMHIYQFVLRINQKLGLNHHISDILGIFPLFPITELIVTVMKLFMFFLKTLTQIL